MTVPVELEIGELVLDGIAPGQEAEIAAALHAELAQRLGAFGAGQPIRLDSVGPVIVPEAASPAEIGRRIALSLSFAVLRATAGPAPAAAAPETAAPETG
jgi:hypothetical protein